MSVASLQALCFGILVFWDPKCIYYYRMKLWEREREKWMIVIYFLHKHTLNSSGFLSLFSVLFMVE